MPKRYNSTIHKLLLKDKKIIKTILSSITRIRLIIYIKDSEEALSVNYIHIKENTKAKETIIVVIITTSHPVRSNAISIINLDASQANI